MDNHRLDGVVIDESGLFAERMMHDGMPDPGYFRVFVQARHIYSFIVVGKLGCGAMAIKTLRDYKTLVQKGADEYAKFIAFPVADHGKLPDIEQFVDEALNRPQD